jgi:5-methylcytosine-specific restriction endonuclease McrBC GTP-binding regulatory subunit McrB
MINTIKEEDMASPIQEILFGSPGTGKSHRVDKIITPTRLKITKSQNIIKAVFHPEYTYGDFVGKLLPITRMNTVKYNYYEGHFLRALAQAYKNLIDVKGDIKSCENVVLVIDEINRGNSSAIFGSVFQLLDRDDDGWSSYSINISDMELMKIIALSGIEVPYDNKGDIDTSIAKFKKAQDEYEYLRFDFMNKKIKMPPNLSILATMNTSDSSIYYMDSAFKRRWDWTFITPESETIEKEGIAFQNNDEWIKFISQLNTFIKTNHKHIRGIEDKQIGRYFIKGEPIKKSCIQNKLMFFIWDSVFSRDKSPLVKLLYGNQSNNDLVTFGDFAKDVDNFISKIKSFKI